MSGVIERCAPWPRHVLTPAEWLQIASTPTPVLLALWADTANVYALFRESTDDNRLLVSTAIAEDGGYPALSPMRPNAVWFERMVHDLWGHAAVGGTDQRPLLDHGRWPHTLPMSMRPGPPGGAPEQPEFASPGDEDLGQIPIGPVWGQIEPPIHLRLFSRGETIVHAETRLGYGHRGTLALVRGKSPRAAARFAARLSGRAAVAHAIAFARATEVALGVAIPERAAALRDVMAAIERAVAHLDVLAALAEATGHSIAEARCAWHAEMVRRAVNIAFGHRLMMDCVIPGGIAADIAPGGGEVISRCFAELEPALPEIEGLAPFDAQLAGIGFGPGGDADARARCRLLTIRESVRMASSLLNVLPAGGVSVPLAPESGEGIGVADGPGGEVWHWLRLDHGQIAAVFVCDDAWARWQQIETVLAGSQTDDMRVVLASFGVSNAGVDL